MRLIGSFISYLAIATVFTAVLGGAYLWRTQRLTDEKMFRLMALLHDVDIDQVAEESQEKPLETPGEEPSVSELDRQRELVMRDHEIKSEALRRGRLELENRLKQVDEKIRRTDQLAREIETRLIAEKEAATKQEVVKVVRDLEIVAPTIAKDLLLQTLEEAGGMEKVILLMGSMQANKLGKILGTFRTADELAKLHSIHNVMLEGGAKKAELENYLKEIQSQ